jgi:hypothetical protein
LPACLLINVALKLGMESSSEIFLLPVLEEYLITGIKRPPFILEVRLVLEADAVQILRIVAFSSCLQRNG